jgi:hypothetical protein
MQLFLIEHIQLARLRQKLKAEPMEERTGLARQNHKAIHEYISGAYNYLE